MADKTAVSVICSVCKNSYDSSSSVSRCPVCGHTESLDVLVEKTKKASSENNVVVYRMMASADAYFAKKSYDEAYIGYSSVLENDRNYLKAYFRRELTSQYLMLASSSVYLSSESFFMKMGEIKDKFRQLDPDDDETQKLRITMCRDMLEYISVRCDYEKQYASAHKNIKTVEVYMANLILLFEYTVETMHILEPLAETDKSKELAYLIIECCSLAMKIRGILAAGAEYIETSDKMEDFSGENSAKNVSRVKRRMLTQNEELDIETKAGYVQKVKNNIVANAEGELYKELRAAKEQAENKVDRDIAEEDKKRAEYEQWRRKNEQEYMEADKVILISDIAGKAAVVFAVIMIAVYIIEMIAFEKKLTVMLVFGIIFIAVRIGLGFLKKAAEKKKEFYSKVIEGDSINLRYGGTDFKE